MDLRYFLLVCKCCTLQELKLSLRSPYFLPLVSIILAVLLPNSVFAQNTRPKVTWHWHMHQPIYWNLPKSGNPDRYEYAWESIQAKDGGRTNPENNLREIFGKDDRVAAYQYRMKDALNGVRFNHPKAGAVTSYSGALMENVRSLGLAGQLGYSSGWKNGLIEANQWDTPSGDPRLDFVNFSFHHGLTGLLPDEIVRMEILLHREIVQQELGVDAISNGYFPTEMAFSTRIIPVLADLGIEWSIVSGEKIARACPDFPIVIGSGGINCDPPNPADQINPNGAPYIRVSIDRGNSPVHANPLSYQPAYAKYVDPVTGTESKIIVVPADMSQGWRDGYSCIDASFLDGLESENDPAQPSLVLLSHDGDNAFGGGFTYYNDCVRDLANSASSKGNEVTSVQQYLSEFPPDTNKIIHVEDGPWVYAESDFGSPVYINWNYPPLDANGNIDPEAGWHEKSRDMALFVAGLNRVETAEQISGHTRQLSKILNPDDSTHPVDRGWHYLLGALDSGNVYYGAALDLEAKASLGVNEAVSRVESLISGNESQDTTPPTIWIPQRHPYNPGGLNFGVQYGYQSYYDDGDFHVWTFIHDVNGPVDAVLKIRIDNDGVNPLSSNQNETLAGGNEVGNWISIPMNFTDYPNDGNPYGKPELNYDIDAIHISDHYWAKVEGYREVLIDYYIEATDTLGNKSISPIQHVYVGDGEGFVGGGGERVVLDPETPVRGEPLTVTYDPVGSGLADVPNVYIHRGKNGWQNVLLPRPAMNENQDGTWSSTFMVDSDATSLQMVFTTAATGDSGNWDNNGGQDWSFDTTGNGTPVPTMTPEPDENPFTMDGFIDQVACTFDDRFYLAEANGWIYVGARASLPADTFIYISSDPSILTDANWAKSGTVGTWDYFLAAEGAGGSSFSSWFENPELLTADIQGQLEHARSGDILEGAIKRELIGNGDVFVALGIFDTDDEGSLLIQIPSSGDGNSNIESAEFYNVDSELAACQSTSPTPATTPTPSPTTTPTPTQIPTITVTPSPTSVITATPTETPVPTASPSPSPTQVQPQESRITIGQGPVIGSTSGQTFFEEFQDWIGGDCKALDIHSDGYLLDDGGDNARDLLAFYAYDDVSNDSIYFRVDFLDLFFQAETTELDVILLIDFNSPESGQEQWPEFADVTTDHLWEAAVVFDEVGIWRVYDSNFQIVTSETVNSGAWLGAYLRSDLDALEFGLDRSVLTNLGWDGFSDLNFQVATVKDETNIEDPNGFGNVSNLTDVIPDPGRGFDDGITNGAVSLTDFCQSAKWAFVLHGNQAISPAQGIQDLIYNDQVTTPNGNPTGYHRALDSARVFGVPANIHVSATLFASLLWADRPGTGDPQDGPQFVEYIKDFLDEDPSNGDGAIIWGVFSEHIMPFFEGDVNQDSIQLNTDYLIDILDIEDPTGNSVFWIPERVARGSTFNDLTVSGFNFTILDQINHIREWFGAQAAEDSGFKIHEVNGVQAFLINDAPDQKKFSNTDDGLDIDTRLLLSDIALNIDHEQLVLVFDDWEAYAGRSFLSFNTGTDNPDNFNTNLRWIANHPWIEVVKLEEIAEQGWDAIAHPEDLNLPFESYDFLDFATEGNYQNWYHGSALEEDFDDFEPWIREDLSVRGSKRFGALTTYLNSAVGASGGAGSIAQDVYADTFFAPDNALSDLARLSYSTAIFETAWHDEFDAIRCPDGTFCNPDTNFDNIAGFAKQLQFLNLRRTGVIVEAAEWAANPPTGSEARSIDLDHDGELEYILQNSRVFAVFENDGGRLIAAFARNTETGEVASMIGNLVGFPDRDDEWEADTNTNARRTSGLSDWWVEGLSTNIYVNDIYAISIQGSRGSGDPAILQLTSGDNKVSKTVSLADDSNRLSVSYALSNDINQIYVRNGLSPDIYELMSSGTSALSFQDTGTAVELSNVNSGFSVALDYGGGSNNALFNASASDGTVNSPRNQAFIHMVELSGVNGMSFDIVLNAGDTVQSTPTPTLTVTPTATSSPSPTTSPTATFTPVPTPTVTPTPTPSPTVSPPLVQLIDMLLGKVEGDLVEDTNSDDILDAADIIMP